MASSPIDHIRSKFEAEGYVCLPAVLTTQECASRLESLEAERRPPLDWPKGHAATSRAYYDFAMHWPLVEAVKAVLGPDVILWGASLIRRKPGEVHVWHSDMESSMPEGRTASLWIGLKETTAESSLKVLPCSHWLGVTLQEVAARAGVARSAVTDALVDAWGVEGGLQSNTTLVPMRDGDVLLFDGRLWHGSHNVSTELNRTALLLQYAEPGTRIRQVDFSNGGWPYDFIEQPLPPCVVVSGRGGEGVNRTVTPPLLPCMPRGMRLTGRVCPLELPLPGGQQGHFSVSQLRGQTHALADLSCHTSALQPGVSPHAPHQHPEEEILLVLQGEVEIWLPGIEGPPLGARQVLRRGELVYYPAGFYHTLTAMGTAPAQYLMLRWLADPVVDRPALRHGRWDAFCHGATSGQPMRSRLHFEGATDWLQRLHCHTTVLDPGAGYEPHEDPYDVVIIVLEGEVETLEKRVRPHGVIFYAAGESHGMRNPGTEAATYLVIEFHGSERAAARLGTDFALKDESLAAADRRVAAARKEVRNLEKKLGRWEKRETSRLKSEAKARARQNWLQKLFNREGWTRRLRRWLRAEK